MNQLARMTIASLVLMGGANQVMAECTDLQGTILTNTINQTTQLGTINLSVQGQDKDQDSEKDEDKDSDKDSDKAEDSEKEDKDDKDEDKNSDDKQSLQGSILGVITYSNASTLPITTYLDHTIVFPGIGVVNTFNDVAQLMPIAGDACSFNVKEQLNIVAGTGRFNGVRGTGMADGTVNFCTGVNQFTISVNLCTRP